MRILVTGGAGFIGSHLVRRLLAQGHRVINLDALKYSGNLDNLSDIAGHPQYGFVQADICDQKRVHEVIEGTRDRRHHQLRGRDACGSIDIWIQERLPGQTWSAPGSYWRRAVDPACNVSFK